MDAFDLARGRPLPGEPDPQPRPARRLLRARRAADRRAGVRGVPVPLRGGRAAALPLDPRRLAAVALAAAGRSRSATGGAAGTRSPRSCRWKLFDNLRRSLAPAALVGLLLACVGGAVARLGVDPRRRRLPAASRPWSRRLPGLVRKPADVPLAPASRGERALARRGRSAQALLTLACLPYEAFFSLDAVAPHRRRGLLVTRRRLLEWTPSGDARRAAPRQGLAGAWARMWIGPAARRRRRARTCRWPGRPASPPPPPSCSSGSPPRRSPGRSAVRCTRRARAADAPTSCASSAASPAGPGASSTPTSAPTITGCRRTTTRSRPPPGWRTARRRPTWDWRCSPICRPTTSATSRPAGSSTAPRARSQAMSAMERHRGHFYNWYDTRSLAPLEPRYISSVDSGNLAGHLLTLRPGLLALAGRADPAGARLPRAARHLRRSSADASSGRAAGRRDAAAEGARRGVRVAADDARRRAGWSSSASPRESRRARRGAGDADRRARPSRLGLGAGATSAGTSSTISRAWPRGRRCRPPRRRGAPARVHLDPDARASWRRSTASGPGPARAQDRRRSSRLAAQATDLAEMEWGFLFDRTRHLLSIGYNVAERRRDPSYYDLLASEARSARFVAIAQGHLPQEHWFALGRLLTTAAGEPRPAVVERLDVRVPRCRCSSCRATRTRCSTRPARRRSRARSSTAGTAACLGHLRVGLQPARRAARPTSTARSACPASASSAAWPTTWSSRPTRPPSR